VPSAESGTFCSVRRSTARGNEKVCFSHATTCVKCDTNCSRGFFSKDCSCHACSVGGDSSWPPVNSEYTAPWHVEGMAACGWQCKSGLSSSTLCSEPGNGLCRLPCPVGTYGDANAMEGCQPCPAGTSSPSENPSNVANASNARHIHDCLQCTPGKYKPALGTLRCETRESASLEQCMLSGTCPDGRCPSACVVLDQDRSVCCRAFADIADSACQELLCTACPECSFSDIAGAASCQACPLHASSTPGSTDRTDCECAPGFEGVDGGACTRCTAGKYKAVAGSVGGVCADCEAGKFSQDDGATICQLCGSGTESVSGSVACTSELVNIEVSASLAMNASYFLQVQDQYVASIADLVGVTPFNVVVTAILNSSSAAVSRRLLLSTSSITIVWVITSPRFHLAALKASIATAFVSRLSDIGPPPTLNALMESCGTGRQPDGVACVWCRQGNYKALADNSSCVACVNGTTTEGKGSILEDSCVCTEGYFLNASVGACAPCQAGTFKLLGPGDCLPCAEGTYSPGTRTGWLSSSCIFCPVETYRSLAGSKSKEDCCGEICDCDAGYNELDGSLQCVPCEPGYYKSVQSTIGTCTECPANSDSPAGSTASTCCICNAGSTGPDGAACTICPSGTFKDSTGSGLCTTCPSSGSSPAGSTDLNSCTPSEIMLQILRFPGKLAEGAT